MNRLTFGLKVIVCFFAFDAAAKAIGIGRLATAGYPPGDARIFVDRYFPLLLALSFDGLLAVQIYLRTRSGRFWGMIYLAALTTLGLFLLVVEPGRWVELGPAGRARELVSYGLYLAFLGILAGRRSARVLVR